MDRARFEPPGPGQWALDRSHFPGATTPISEELMERSMERGMRRVFAEIGTPADTLQARFVNGFMYTRLRPLIAPDKPARKAPPKALLWVVAHLHPGLRRRAKAAARTFDTKSWEAVARRWDAELKPRLVASNRAFQDVEPDELDDAALAAHVEALLAHLHETAEMHFWLHGYDLGPIAAYLHDCKGWGIPAAEAVAALAGASPSTAAPVRRLCRLRAIVEASGTQPESLDAVRACSPEAAALLDEHLAERGHHLVTRYDVDGLTLLEMPGTVLQSILDASEPPAATHDAVSAELRARVPADDRARFDEVLADARGVMDLRDDNGPNTYEWPAGLLRRALLSAGRRLAATGRLHEPEHVLDAGGDEVRALLTGGGPTADELAARAQRRHANALLDPPPTLGPDEPAPDLSVLPKPLPRIVAMVQTAIEELGMAGEVGADPLAGTGVGSGVYRGRVRRAASPEEAIDTMEPGDVLVVRVTSPAFNAVLGIAGAVVTADGGPLSHAAVLARELGIPAVVGVPGALDLADGSTIDVDAAAGRIRLVTS